MSLATLLKKICPSSQTPLLLELDLSRGVLSAPPTNPLAAMKAMNAPTVRAIREGLRKAAADDRVKGLVVHVGTAAFTPAQGEELADLIRDFGKHKPTMAIADTFGEFASAVFAYKLAAAASDVWLQPSGMLSIGGVHVEITLLKGTLAKLGIEPQFGQRKEYKTAADRFAADEVTEANREMTTRLAQSLMDEAVASIVRDRELDTDAVWQAVDTSPLTPDEARCAGFIDHVGYRDEAMAAVHAALGTSPEHQLFVHRYMDAGKISQLLPAPGKPAVAVVDIRGAIVTGRGAQGGFNGPSAGSDVVCEHLRSAVRDDSVKAVILRVDSPGGSYVASDSIRRAVMQIRESGRLVVAVMGDVAASGGYFVSMGANEIVAQPSTITGSIGVLAGKLVTRGLYEKIGLKREGINVGARAGMLATDREFTEDDWRLLDEELDRIYADFTAKAASDRGLDLDVLEPLARGRVWTGADAAERGLVDHLGGMDYAIDRVCELAGFERDTLRLKPVGVLGLVERFKPARSTETMSGASVALPSSPDELFGAMAAAVGLTAPGVLSLPVRPTVTG